MTKQRTRRPDWQVALINRLMPVRMRINVDIARKMPDFKNQDAWSDGSSEAIRAIATLTDEEAMCALVNVLAQDMNTVESIFAQGQVVPVESQNVTLDVLRMQLSETQQRAAIAEREVARLTRILTEMGVS